MIYPEKNREIYLKHLSEVIPDYDTFVGIQNYLDSTDFFTAPCSTKYHLSVEGGLCQHHLNVEENIIKLLQAYDSEVDVYSARLVALTHDWCKIDYYVPAMVSIPPDKSGTGKWEKEWKFKKDPALTLGHGAASIYRINKVLDLTFDEAEAIFNHMGAFDLSNYHTINDVSTIFESNKLSFFLHMADMMSTYITESGE